MEHLSACPICNNTAFKPFLKAKDYFLTMEGFTIQQCLSCKFLFTNPRPEKEEIGKYYRSESYISHSDSTKGLINKIYQTIRSKTLNEKASWIYNHKKQGRVLDIGAGTGHFLNAMARKGYSVTGMEPEESARKIAKAQFDLILYNELESIPDEGDRYDVITLWHVLEHVHELDATLKRIRSLVSDAGILVVAVPNPESYDAQKYGKYWAAYDLPRHLYHFTRETITKTLKPYGFELSGSYPMKFDSYYVSMLSEKYKSGKTNYLKAVQKGFLSNFHARGKRLNYSSLTYIFTIKN
jgi:2-polyprenyl-3-methyl-5-hydroxy-6-metoxy-1,4-benzoquinol methylase